MNCTDRCDQKCVACRPPGAPDLPPLPEPDCWAILTPNGSKLVSPEEAKGAYGAYALYTSRQMGEYRLAPGVAPRAPDETAMVDAAMAEMSNIHPPLRRSECERLIRAALGMGACANCHPNVAPEYRCKDCPAGVPGTLNDQEKDHG